MSIGVSIKAKSKGVIRNVAVRDSNFHDHFRWCIDIAPRSGDGVTFSNVTIAGNRFHDYYQYDALNWQGCGE